MKSKLTASFIMAALMLAVFASCQKDSLTLTLYSQDYDNGGAKTSIDGSYNVNWVSGDAVNINGATKTIEVVQGSAILNDVENASAFYVAYPASYATTVSGSGITSYTMPTSYTYDASSTVCPMAGYTTSGVVVMKNLTGLLAITMNQNITVTEVVVSSPNMAFSGAGSVTFSDGEPTWSRTHSGADTSVTMSFGGGKNMNGGCTFYLPVPPISNGSRLCVRVRVNDNGTLKDYVKTRTTTAAIGKNQIARMSLNTESMALVDNGLGDVTVAAFTVNASGKQVYFSKGNLQYQASTSTWRIAEHQYDFVGGTTSDSQHYGNVDGSTNNTRGASYSGWQDLFGWGTSGCAPDGQQSYPPYMTSTSNSDYYTGAICGSDDLWKYDLGYAYSLQLGDNSHWRTLTAAEWQYVIGRSNHATKATVADVVGVILLPDGEWTTPSGVSLTINMNSYTANVYTTTQWDILANAGAVFLPTTGRMGSEGYVFSNPDCQYWTATLLDASTSNIFTIREDDISVEVGSHYVGNAVRLVKDKVD